MVMLYKLQVSGYTLCTTDYDRIVIVTVSKYTSVCKHENTIVSLISTYGHLNINHYLMAENFHGIKIAKRSYLYICRNILWSSFSPLWQRSLSFMQIQEKMKHYCANPRRVALNIYIAVCCKFES